MRMLVSTGLGMLGTVGLFAAYDWATTCTACVRPDDGGFGSSLIVVGALLVPLGLLPSLLRRLRSAR